MRRVEFFGFWMLIFVAAHLWSFHTAPWNGDGVFADSARAVLDLKSRGIGQPFQAAWWFGPPDNWSTPSLYHYYLWPWLSLFGYNLEVVKMAGLALWSATFIFTLLLTDLFFKSRVITSVIALLFTFLPFAFIYTFVGYYYDISVTLCVVSLYFLLIGFRTDCYFCIAIGGISAGLCLWSSVLGQQYIAALAICAVLRWKLLRQRWRQVGTAIYGFVVAAAPILFYMAFNWREYAFHQSAYTKHLLDWLWK